MKTQVHTLQGIEESCGAALLIIIYVCSKHLRESYRYLEYVHDNKWCIVILQSFYFGSVKLLYLYIAVNAENTTVAALWSQC